ncbi:arylalkylamine N-acetyltransferase-like 2 [Drosophila nasuta]|uniref:arylalkylamine N-acetyltransferase-like 2 n=1 Tax=Drosophila nasuta TaxID=42062 RepID=UPI00295E4823|nr:arylalkylamine N-acetyltransferase-like 2 [Drosophila nasuta]
MTTNFGTKDGILIRVMTKDDLRIIENSIYDEEPLQLALVGNSKAQMHQSLIEILDKFHNSMVEQGTCLVAINEKDGERIVGCILAGCETSDDLQEYHAQISTLDECAFKTVGIFECETKIKVNYFQYYSVSKVIYAAMINVDASMRGRGLRARLANVLKELGRSKGFKVIKAWSSSFYSARQMEGVGMECIYRQPYADYKDAKGQVIFKPPALHSELRISALKL